MCVPGLSPPLKGPGYEATLHPIALVVNNSFPGEKRQVCHSNDGRDHRLGNMGAIFLCCNNYFGARA